MDINITKINWNEFGDICDEYSKIMSESSEERSI